jgi:hypothetical protein
MGQAKMKLRRRRVAIVGTRLSPHRIAKTFRLYTPFQSLHNRVWLAAKSLNVQRAIVVPGDCIDREKIFVAVLNCLVGLFVLVCIGCSKQKQQATANQSPIPKDGPLAAPRFSDQIGFPAALTQAAIPPDNPQTPEKIALGRKLFFDGRLSADGTVACASCHNPEHAFTDGRPTSVGIHGQVGQRNAPTVLNALYNKAQFWDGRAKTLEDQASFPIINPIEMGQPSLDAAIARIAAIEDYRQAFSRVFGRQVNGPDLVSAIASYERSLTSFNSPFDRFIAGDKNAINAAVRSARTGSVHPGPRSQRQPQTRH